LVGSARADKLTRAEIGKLGKAVTAYVEVPGRGSGTAFCVHRSGLFVTNDHVVRGQEAAGIKVVIDSGLKTQRVLPATVVRAEKDADLALLRVSSKDELPSVPLGPDDDLTELAEVVGFGFPLGAALAGGKNEYPAISVNAGNVSALRRKGGDVQFIQVDVSVTYGNSGGPVLDESGTVVGVIVSGVPGQRGLNMAIPVRRVRRFLAAPEIQFTAPELTFATIDRPARFEARVVSFVPGAKEPDVRLTLQAGDERPRSFNMTNRDGVFVVTATPAPRRTDARVEISINFDAGTVSGVIDNVVLKVGGKPVKVGEVRQIELKPKPRAVLADGTAVEGEVAGLGPTEVSLGGEKATLDLRKATHLTITPQGTVGVVMATVIASVDGTEVARVSRRIGVRGAPAPGGAWTALGGKNPFPAAFEPSDKALADKDGLRLDGRRYIKTVKGDYLTRDFKFELVYTLSEATDAGITFIGIGEAEPGGAYDEPKNSVFLKIHPPNVDGGAVGLANGPNGGALPVGKISKNGTHRAIIEKKGDVVTFGIDVDNDGQSDDDLERTVPDIKAFGRFLHKKNTYIFFGGGGTFKQFRLSE
jgi:S1-C subfamily serine protease